jgi:hypothetical protein
LDGAANSAPVAMSSRGNEGAEEPATPDAAPDRTDFTRRLHGHAISFTSVGPQHGPSLASLIEAPKDEAPDSSDFRRYSNGKSRASVRGRERGIRSAVVTCLVSIENRGAALLARM